MTVKKTTAVAMSLSALALAIAANVNAAPAKGLHLQADNARINQASPLPKRYIVKFKNAQAAAQADANSLNDYQPRANEVFSQHRALNSVKAKQMKRIGRSNAYSAQLDNNGVKALKLRADVDYVEEDMPRHLLSETTPWGQTFVGATSLSDSMAGNRTICIIDSGYDRSHSELSGNNVTGTNNSGTGNWYEPGAHNAQDRKSVV